MYFSNTEQDTYIYLGPIKIFSIQVIQHPRQNTQTEQEAKNSIMVIGLLAITAIPTVTGVAFGVSEQRKANTRMQDEKRMAKFYMQVYCEGDSEKAQSLNGRRAVLRDNKVCPLL